MAVTVEDTSNSVNQPIPSNQRYGLIVTRTGSDTIVVGGGGAFEAKTNEWIREPNGSRTFISDGVSVWRIRDMLTLRQLTFPYAASGHAQTGIFWDNPGTGSAIVMDSGAHEMRLISRKRVAIVSGFDFMGEGFIQFGNNGPTAEKIFISQEGQARAAAVHVPSHRFALNCAWWDGAASVSKCVVLQGNTDAAGNPVFEFFAPGGGGAGSLNKKELRWEYSSGTKAATLGAGGLEVASVRLDGGSGAAPALAFTGDKPAGLFAVNGTVGMTVAGTEPMHWSAAGTCVGANGTPIAGIVSAAARLDYGTISAGDKATRTIAVAGAVTNNIPSISLGWSAALEDGIVIKQAWVSSPETVSVQVANTSQRAIVMAPVTCRATVSNFQ
jgi:hypothetical protein